MKLRIGKCVNYGLLVLICSVSIAEAQVEIPLSKNVASCELDLNNDGNLDIAISIETSRGKEVIALLKNGNGYNAFVLRSGKSNMYLSCLHGENIYETSAGKGTRKTYKTLGSYIQLTQPEGASVAYFWNGSGFNEVWTAD